MVNIRLDLPIRLTAITVDRLNVTTSGEAFQELQRCAAFYREQYGGRDIGQVPGVQYARQLFRELGIEPTRHRPASEALLRRALKNLPLYSINNLVDVCNFCALDFLLPNGVYDLQKLAGKIILRRGKTGEEYLGHTGQVVHLEGRYTLVDELGPFGSPITDSLRAAVCLQTTQALIIVYAPLTYPEAKLAGQLAMFSERLATYCQADDIEKLIISGNSITH
ncbi:MAG TPA: phenylalanine--tRNA ligase beta subunit-related protein [Candidatus Marinimicrobia bacterium]|nr:phenylalanine--tRNA ligase beta subunit-related protein [Candidatus Neomarinimicrobiota bacterium]HRS51047.1 phenylalanine--tRNA ligase beta subunit-related protein [Candidatus Neomarinimicrobiota bacterium]HRU92554.1 phenylalanine--tRNA ligase beta subunit-related protein [Candidatus Neomarinimicrobiota bacterium]